MDVVVTTTNEHGEPGAGWHVVAHDLQPGFAASLIKQGEKSRAGLPAGSPRRAEIAAWISTLKSKGYVPVGSYQLQGRATIFVERATEATRMAARERSDMAQWAHRARLLPGADNEARDRRIEWHKRMTAAGAAAIERFEAQKSRSA